MQSESQAALLMSGLSIEGGGVMADIGWTDVEELGIRLMEAHPDVDPLSVRFTDLHKWVTALEGFAGDPKDSNEKKLEAIQMAWYEEWQEENG
jgi:FeS assembly protein IscX